MLSQTCRIQCGMHICSLQLHSARVSQSDQIKGLRCFYWRACYHIPLGLNSRAILPLAESSFCSLKVPTLELKYCSGGYCGLDISSQMGVSVRRFWVCSCQHQKGLSKKTNLLARSADGTLKWWNRASE